VANGLRKQHGDAVDLHFCSFAKLASRVPEGMTFHPIEGKGVMQLYSENWQKAHPGERPGECSSVRYCPLDYIWQPSRRLGFSHPRRPEAIILTYSLRCSLCRQARIQGRRSLHPLVQRPAHAVVRLGIPAHRLRHRKHFNGRATRLGRCRPPVHLWHRRVPQARRAGHRPGSRQLVYDGEIPGGRE
jgi:hypothetical protein